MSLKLSARRVWPLVVALIATALTVGWTLSVSLHQSGGHIVYGLDDAYIHMTIARTLAQHGVWGINAEQFVSASSSPLWVVVLAAADRLIGVHEITSLVLNVVLSALLLCLVFAIAVRRGMTPVWTCVLLLSVGLLTPVSVLVMNGMEHVLQTIADVGFVAAAVAVLSEGDSRSARGSMLILAPFVAATRYEGVFLIAIVALFLVIRRRWFDGLLVAALGALPVVVFGLFSIAHGGFFLPNSVLVKTHYYNELAGAPSRHALFAGAMRVPRLLLAAPHLLILILVSTVLAARALYARERWTPVVLWNGIFVVTLLAHLQLAAVGGYRYEAYLIVLGLVAIAVTTIPMQRPAALLLATACLIPLITRAYQATTSTPTSVANVYQQQYQMGLFVREYYPDATVAVNDIGAVSFLGERSRILDLVGLGNMETAAATLSDSLTASFYDRLARKENVDIAIVYEQWFPGQLPPGWRKVAKWTIPDRVSVAYDTVTFFSADSAHEPHLVASLRAFSPALPSPVQERRLFSAN